MSSTEWARLLTLPVLSGGTFFLVEVALLKLPPLTIVLGPVSIAAAALLVPVHARGQRMPATLSG